jgi:putative ABC transport system permease protein
MKHGFFSRIAVENIRKNTRLYVPRILAEAGLLGCFYILLTLSMDKRMSDALGGAYLSAFMAFGAIVIGLLSFVLILYINSFLMKQRKQEYGLYNVLGMEKRHIVRVLFFESLFTSLLSVALGLVFGALDMIPGDGEQDIELDFKNLHIHITRVEDHQIAYATVTKLEQPAGEKSDAD